MRPLTLRSIVVATDLRDGSDPVVLAAAALAGLAGSDLRVVHVADDGVDEGAVRAAMEEQVGRVAPPDAAEPELCVERGSAPDAIRRAADEARADLVVVGAHHPEHADGGLGSTADRIVRTAWMPCLVLRGPLALPLRCVVAPVDLSAASEGALDVALSWTSALRVPGKPDADDATVLRVVAVESDDGDGGLAPPAEGRPAAVPARLGAAVEAALGRTHGAAGVRVRTEVLRGAPPARPILDLAARAGADLMVVGTHGRNAAVRARIGSVSSALAREAVCPVVLVPPAVWSEREE